MSDTTTEAAVSDVLPTAGPALAAPPAAAPKAGLRRLLDPALYPEITIRRGAFFCAWFVPHIIIVSYYGGRNDRPLVKRMNVASMASILFDAAAILVFMSPTFLAVLQRTLLPRFIVIEKRIHAHKVASYTLIFWCAVHIGIYYQRYIAWTKPHESKGKMVPGVPLVDNLFHEWTGWTGHVLAFSLLLIIVTSIGPIRRRLFEVFYYAHHLFVLFVVVLFLHHHNRMAYKYLSGPVAVYCVDRLYRALRSAFARAPLRAVIQHPSGVVELQLDKRVLGHRVGQYVKVCCPSVSLLQWHPMTISSAPEEELLTLHFRLAGGWTHDLAKRLGCNFGPDPRSSVCKQLVSGRSNVEAALISPVNLPYHPLHHDPTTVPFYSQVGCGSSYISIDMITRKGAAPGPAVPAAPDHDGKARNSSSKVRADDDKQLVPAQVECGDVIVKGGPELPTIFVDGPYAAPSERFFEYDVCVLIAAGIGITPAAAVLRSVYFQWLHDRDRLRTKKVYLFWVYRDIGTLEWFRDLLVALDEEGLSEIVETHTYFTGRLPEARSPQPASDKSCFGKEVMATTIGTSSYIGRPDFDDIFGTIGPRHPETCIGTFLCGPKPMVRSVRRLAHRWDRLLQKQSGTSLDFHAETF
ncbi:NADPH oxidase 3 [Coemansia javaensis]|uniref:NADPH oxidase 3 n=1 Tax=Coemansia javaensis TaxID=2761396 RepID=A0A9W8H4V2_9FUNG|nr:NADPH oxidase 3 [Coemansia javaensis]